MLFIDWIDFLVIGILPTHMQACVVFVHQIGVGNSIFIGAYRLGWLTNIEIDGFVFAAFGRILTTFHSERFKIIYVL